LRTSVSLRALLGVVLRNLMLFITLNWAAGVGPSSGQKGVSVKLGRYDVVISVGLRLIQLFALERVRVGRRRSAHAELLDPSPDCSLWQVTGLSLTRLTNI
jgi:hypothetical protein